MVENGDAEEPSALLLRLMAALAAAGTTEYIAEGRIRGCYFCRKKLFTPHQVMVGEVTLVDVHN